MGHMIFSISSILLYLTATALLGCRLLWPALSDNNALRIGSIGTTTFGVTLHGIVLYQTILTQTGLNLGISNVASLVTWGIVLVLLVGTIARPLVNLGILVLPLAAITIALTRFYPSEHMLSESVALGVEIHVVLSILAASVLSVAAIQSVFLAFQERSLRRKRLTRILQVLPPLQVQESVFFQLIGVGFFLLSLSLASGMAFIEDMFAQHLAHKTLLSLLAWVVFAVLLWGRWRFGWRGRRAVRWSLTGFTVLMLAYFGSKMVLEIILGRAWY
ncbi:MAG: cytochrome c biogenesis protein CcsA [Gammaproteobacteria bacterium]|nr:cytochrome c biogenesis protein CcsA [Gammaproteobacteria bacterium]NNJ83723.1 cytochrome c biogenesis protein CcsA [Gammaproteobacteria bacterium]